MRNDIIGAKPYLINVEGTPFPEGAIGLETKDCKVIGDHAFIRIEQGGYDQSGFVPVTHLHRDGQRVI